MKRVFIKNRFVLVFRSLSVYDLVNIYKNEELQFLLRFFFYKKFNLLEI